MVFVPAFCGLFAPYWHDDARGVIVGLTLAELGELRVDGGMTKNELLMQFQADVLGSHVVGPAAAEITATGAAYAAGLATGFWSGLDDLRAN